MNGTITITRGDKVTVHTYTSPPEGWLVNTHILEGPTKLVIFDGQLMKACADEAAAYARQLDKPVERIILSHPHPDHWSGFEVLTARFPQAEVHALPSVTEVVRAAGEIMLGKLQPFGDMVASRVTVPSCAISVGAQDFDGARQCQQLSAQSCRPLAVAGYLRHACATCALTARACSPGGLPATRPRVRAVHGSVEPATPR
jgi:Metallo-beta-lactamase superfamily